jgi:hypothetical protein
MPTRFKVLAIAAALAAGTSSAAMAQCAPGYYYANGICQPAGAPGYGNPVSGAASGEAAGAAQGYGSGMAAADPLARSWAARSAPLRARFRAPPICSRRR